MKKAVFSLEKAAFLLKNKTYFTSIIRIDFVKFPNFNV